MQLHMIQPKTKRKSRKRVGRGGARGRYSGRGIKGQKARAGRKIRPEMRDIIKKIHKKRGYRFSSIQEKPVTVNVGIFDSAAFATGTTVSPRALIEQNIIRRRGKIPRVKVLGDGTISKKLIFNGFSFSESARKKIEDAGGVIQEEKI